MTKTPAKRAPAKRATPAKKAQKAVPAKKTAPAKRAPKVAEEAAPAETSAATEPAKAIAVAAPLVVVPVENEQDERLDLRPVPVARPMLRLAPRAGAAQRFESLAEELLAEPSRTPEILALAAVRVFGPRAKDWADRTRSVYPSATREAVARLAVQRFTRAAGLRGAVGALAGPYSPVALGAGILVTHAEMVLHLAAAFEVDPEDPRRAEDLLRLASPGQGAIVAWLVLKAADRALPGVSLISTMLGARSATETLAVRATRLYREKRPKITG
ncbi:hypothetical protein [Actinoplanes derwentensis]|nr:hypothetical protein [Actinoplanes derwentensis]